MRLDGVYAPGAAQDQLVVPGHGKSAAISANTCYNSSLTGLREPSMNTEAIHFVAKAILDQTPSPEWRAFGIRYEELVRHGLLHRRLDQCSHP